MRATEFLKELKKLNKEDLVEIKGIGDVLAQNIEDFFNSPRYQKLLQGFAELENQGNSLDIRSNLTNHDQNKLLSSKSVCITGTFEISRDKIKETLEQNGAKVTNTVTSNTDYLLVGENPGSKVDKAKKVGVEIVTDLEKFLKMLRG
jgi:DNA ligase (NAD+)